MEHNGDSYRDQDRDPDASDPRLADDPGPLETEAVGESSRLDLEKGYSTEGPPDPGPIETVEIEEEE